MSTADLKIDETLKSKLDALLKEFELSRTIDYSTSKEDVSIPNEEVAAKKDLSVNVVAKEEKHKESKLNAFLHWFFVTEYKTEIQ